MHQSLPCLRPVGGQEGTLLCLLCSKRIYQRLSLFQDSSTSQIPQNNVSLGHTLPQGIEETGWLLILHMVQKRGAK